MNPASLIITNADIITMDPAGSRAEAVAVTDGVITAVGTTTEVAAAAGPDTQIIDLAGSVLAPGFVEAHGHVLLMAQFLATNIADVRSFTCPTWNDVAEAIKQKVAQTPRGQAVLVYGFDGIDHGRVAPTSTELDEFTVDHPMVLLSFTGHSATVNSAALRLAGITQDTPDPAGGSFGHFADGSPDGTAHEAGAVGALVLPLMAVADLDIGKSMASQCAAMAAAGYTTVGELIVQPHDRPLLDAIVAWPQLPIRFRLYEATNSGLQAQGSFGDTNPIMRQTGVKLWVDGTPLEGNVLLKEPFLDTEVTRNMGLEPNCCGSANYSREQLLELVRAYAPSGFQMACHVQGDAAIDRILDVYEQVLTERGLLGTDHRWRLEHCGTMTAQQFQRAASLGVSCSMFPAHLYYWGDVITNDILGVERGNHWMRMRSALDSGMKISLHNDGYLTPPDPIGNIQHAVTRVGRRSGNVLGADQVITVDEAMRAQTIDAAWHLFSDHEVGSIEVGKLADFVHLSRDPYTVEPAQLKDQVTVLGTWIGGVRVLLGEAIESNQAADS